MLAELRPVEVLHNGRCFKSWVTAQRRDGNGWHAYVVGVGPMQWLWQHEDESRCVVED